MPPPFARHRLPCLLPLLGVTLALSPAATHAAEASQPSPKPPSSASTAPSPAPARSEWFTAAALRADRSTVVPTTRAPSPARRALASGAALVPGALVHGAGHWVLGEPKTARSLFLLEGAGAVTAVGSVALIAWTGASPYLVAPLAFGALGGLGLFSLTLLADLYGVAAPAGGLGAPSEYRYRLTVESGVRWVDDPLFDHGVLLAHGLRFEAPGFWLAPRADIALDSANRRYALFAGKRWVDPLLRSRGADRVLFELGGGITDHDYDDDGFATTTLELFAKSRLDLEALGPTLEGSFAEALVGYARQWTRFDGIGTDGTDELLARGAFGVYLGRAPGISGETWLAYDHRRDTFAGGLRIPGVGAGYAGYLEQRLELFFGGTFGAASEFAYGSALIGSALLLVRLDPERPKR